MLSDYRYRKLKRQQKKAEYNQMVRDKKLISREQLVCEYESAYRDVFGTKPKRIPANRRLLKLSAMKMQAQLHNEEISDGLED